MKIIRETDYEELQEDVEITEEELDEYDLEDYDFDRTSISEIISIAVMSSMIGLLLCSVFSINTAREVTRSGIVLIVTYLIYQIYMLYVDNIQYDIFVESILFASLIWVGYGMINRFTGLGLIPPLIVMIISLMAAAIYLVIKY